MLNERHLSMAQFSRISKISEAQVSRVMNGIYNPGQFFLERTSKALKIPLEHVYMAAGILPPPEEKSDNLYVRELNHVAGQLVKDSDLKELLYLAKMKLKNQDEEEK